ncbi:MAG: TRAM domain-containing protein [Coriobacteriia bacterium]|nr:TRAM domain-containing protein [Coriobacteriia bacterium]
MITHATRFVLLTAGGFGGFAIARLAVWTEQTPFSPEHVILIFVILGCSIGYILGGIVGRELETAYCRAEERLQDLLPTDLVLAATGLVTGLVVALLVSYPLRFVSPPWLAFTTTGALLFVAAYVGIRVGLVKRVQVAAAFPRLNGDKDRPDAARPKYLDTSAVIDGRFVELLRSGFLEGPVKVPRFVVAELHTLADSADDIRRARGRRGLDLLESLSSTDSGLELLEVDYPELATVDDKLVRLAADSGGSIVTVDYNLSKAARVREAGALNVNELAQALRPTHLPGETLRLTIVREGKESDQGVGYLEDGTMVVVQGGRERIGSEAETEVTSVLQTSAGRMIFSKLKAV